MKSSSSWLGDELREDAPSITGLPVLPEISVPLYSTEAAEPLIPEGVQKLEQQASEGKLSVA